jgi:predicted XRE-type DNA-binding protein
MNKSKQDKLAKAGWKTGSAAEFLGLSPAEETFVEMKLSLASELRSKRRKTQMTQAEVATLIESSQSRVAKMEAGDPSVTLDLLIKSLLAMGASKKEVASALASRH